MCVHNRATMGLQRGTSGIHNGRQSSGILNGITEFETSRGYKRGQEFSIKSCRKLLYIYFELYCKLFIVKMTNYF